jgi:hypothetical protein
VGVAISKENALLLNIAELLKYTLGLKTPALALASQMYVAYHALPHAYNFATSVHNLFKSRLATFGDDQVKAYIELLDKMRGNPFESSVANAREAASTLKKTIKKKLGTSLKTNSSAHLTVYSITSNRRFMFYEYYRNDDYARKIKQKLPPLRTRDDWYAVPDGGALRLLPPVQVAESLFEAEQLRGMPLTQTTNFTTGGGGLAARTPAGVAAKAAHAELMQVIASERSVLKGVHLMQTAKQAGMHLATAGTALIQAAYGVAIGVTFVDGDDPVWTCFHGGAAARLAIRHLSVFKKAEVEVHDAEATMNYWRSPRRSIVQEFARSWVAEANATAEESPALPPLQAASIDAARVFARISALSFSKPYITQTEVDTVLAVAASSVAHVLNAKQTDATVRMYVSTETPDADAFRDQVHLEPPKNFGSRHEHAPWACRRIAPKARRRRAAAPPRRRGSV